MTGTHSDDPEISQAINIIGRITFEGTAEKPQRSFVYFHDETNCYRVETLFEPYDIDHTNAMDHDPLLIPFEHMFPLCFSGLTVAALEQGAAHYVKLPQCISYNLKNPCLLARRLLHEAQILEALSKSPHENIVQYMGCVVEKGRIRGICLERCVENLYDRMNNGKTLVKENVIDSIWKAVTHLHGVGFCHNDISPWNIMFREDDSVVLIDFDSCQRIGQAMGEKKGSPGFYDESATTSMAANDFYSIARVEEYLATECLPDKEIYEGF